MRGSKRLLSCSSLAFVLLVAVFGITSNGGVEQVVLRNEGLSSEGFYSFSFDASPSKNYPVAVSVDLLNWVPLTNIVGTRGSLSVADQTSSHLPQRFYRVAPVPIPITNMVFIPGGTFVMGSTTLEVGHKTIEEPQTTVTLSRGFWIGRFEVTQREYLSLMGSNISFFTFDPQLPVDGASWLQASNYCQKLTDTERSAGHLPAGFRYRLPTEAEWEYVARAGRPDPFGVGDGRNLSSSEANFDGNFPYGAGAPGPYIKLPKVVGSYPPNSWGIYDLHGNVFEWCQDYFGAYNGGNVTDPGGPAAGSTRVLRGGCYTSAGQGCRAANREHRSPTFRDITQGFRVVLVQDL